MPCVCVRVRVRVRVCARACVSCACVMAAQIGYQLKTISLSAVYLSVNQSVSRRHSLEQLSVVYTWLQRRPGTGLVLFGKLL